MVAVAVAAASVWVTGTGPGARRFMLFRASDTCLATMSEIFCNTDADKSESSRLSCMFASAAGKSSGTVPPCNSIAIVSNKGSTVARSLSGEASITPLFRRSEYFKKRPFRFHAALRPRRRDGLLGTGTEWEGDDRVKARPRKPPEKDLRDRGPPPEQWKC